MTGLSARNFRLHQRGQLKPGWHADVVVFDPATVKDVATYDQPIARSEGIRRVYVNGQLACEQGSAQVLAYAGRMLKRQAPP
jgi:N-acyl-D-amino-acid deacylase